MTPTFDNPGDAVNWIAGSPAAAELLRQAQAGERLAAAIDLAYEREQWGDDFEVEVVAALGRYRIEMQDAA